LSVTIGIRCEDKNEWERRVPLTPADAAAVQAASGARVLVEPSPIRVFGDEEYRAAGLEVTPAAVEADILLAVKEIPDRLYRPGGVYVCFSHTIKGQPYNMPNLRTLLERGATLVDYERIVDERGRRLIFFSVHAGYAGMIESLRALALRLESRGVATPLLEIRPAWQYGSLAEAEAHLDGIGGRLARDGIPGREEPLVIGIAGYGNVSRGAQRILAHLPVAEVTPEQLPEAARTAEQPLVLTVFREEHMVRRRDGGPFDLQEYYDHPELYTGRFEEHLPHLDLLVNSIYWTDRYPRLLTRTWAEAAFAGGGEPRLQVVGDISIDIEGAIELSVKATHPDRPCYVVDPVSGTVTDGVAGRGIVIMAVDNLPCELSRESSEHFSSILRDMVPDLARADWSRPFAELDLPPHLRAAVIAHRGELTPDYAYLADHLAAAED